MNGQMSLNDFFGQEQATGPVWHDYINRIDGRKVTAYKCEDKDWYVIHGITNDWYQMEQKRAFESTYDRIYRTEGI